MHRGADPHIIDRDGSTLLHGAAGDKPPATVRLLLGVGMDAGATDNLGRTALHCAAMSGDVESVKALLHSGANVMARLERKYTSTPGHGISRIRSAHCPLDLGTATAGRR